jgi:hypothetical protein
MGFTMNPQTGSHFESLVADFAGKVTGAYDVFVVLALEVLS